MSALALSAATGWGAAPRVLCSTFPIYQITRNVAQGREGVTVELLLPSLLGCPHHYALTPQDLRKLSRASVLVVNGLGLEEFLGAPLRKTHPHLTIVDSSRGVEGVLPIEEGGHDSDEKEEPGSGSAERAPAHDSAVNPHLFASPRLSAHLARHIAEELSGIDPEGAGVYARNAEAYAGKMQALADEMAMRVRSFKNNRIVQPHGVFDYLARDIGLEIVAVIQPHGQEPSAAEMLAIVKTLREKKAGAVFTEPTYSPKVGQTLAREAGLPVAVLDSTASGPEDAPLDYYEKVMRGNLKTLQTLLGP
jgi:ABC-type Zn uptake system ZnuABC Zn-binding protein ZnuA